MTRHRIRSRIQGRLVALMLATFALLASGLAFADPPSRVARIGHVSGTVSLSVSGDGQWIAAPVNRPLTVGDRLWSGPGARAELQTGGAVARLGPETLVSMLDFDDRVVQLQLSQGTLRLRVRSLEPGQVYEIATPNLAFTAIQPGEYRVDVDPASGSTLVLVRSGQAEVDSENTAYTIYAGRSYRFSGTGLRSHAELPMPPADDLDRWAQERDQRWVHATASAYVSPDVVGYEELDNWGTWQPEPNYGAVWFPRSVQSDWSPYAYGHWSWIPPWGWTWIDDAPWGFAVTHYGRWARFDGRWGWVPGPVRARAVYAPALVAFVGGPGFQLSWSSGPSQAIAWYPLAPREVYRPWYTTSRGYFSSINVTNTVIAPTQVHRFYDNPAPIHDRHANRGIPGAVIAVPSQAFARSQPVNQAGMRVRDEDLARARNASRLDIAPVRPEPRPDAGRVMPPPVFERPAVTRHAPAAVGQPGPETPRGLPGRQEPQPRNDWPVRREPVQPAQPRGESSPGPSPASGPFPASGPQPAPGTRPAQPDTPALPRTEQLGGSGTPGNGQRVPGNVFRPDASARPEPQPAVVGPAPSIAPRPVQPVQPMPPAQPAQPAQPPQPPMVQPRIDTQPRPAPRMEAPVFERPRPVERGPEAVPMPRPAPQFEERARPQVPSAPVAPVQAPPERPRPQFEAPRMPSPQPMPQAQPAPQGRPGGEQRAPAEGRERRGPQQQQ